MDFHVIRSLYLQVRGCLQFQVWISIRKVLQDKYHGLIISSRTDTINSRSPRNMQRHHNPLVFCIFFIRNNYPLIFKAILYTIRQVIINNDSSIAYFYYFVHLQNAIHSEQCGDGPSGQWFTRKYSKGHGLNQYNPIYSPTSFEKSKIRVDYFFP